MFTRLDNDVESSYASNHSLLLKPPAPFAVSAPDRFCHARILVDQNGAAEVVGIQLNKTEEEPFEDEEVVDAAS